MRPFTSLLTLSLLAWLCGASARADHAASAWKSFDGRTVVFVAEGAGHGTPYGYSVIDGLHYLANREGLPIHVQPVYWCRYYNDMNANYTDHEGHRLASRALAYQIHLLHKECPTARIVLVGYSAGSRIILSAAEMSPPGSIDRIVLLSPTVSCYYDLRAALRATHGGLDCFYSIFDGFLKRVAASLGTSDGVAGETAGRYGFWLPGPREYYPEYCGLRLHPWGEAYGGQGGHLSFARYTFLHDFLGPMVATPAPASVR